MNTRIEKLFHPHGVKFCLWSFFMTWKAASFAQRLNVSILTSKRTSLAIRIWLSNAQETKWESFFNDIFFKLFYEISKPSPLILSKMKILCPPKNFIFFASLKNDQFEEKRCLCHQSIFSIRTNCSHFDFYWLLFELVLVVTFFYFFKAFVAFLSSVINLYGSNIVIPEKILNSSWGSKRINKRLL